MSNPADFREPYFAVGDTVEVLTGGYELLNPEATGDAELIGDAEGVYTVKDVEGGWHDMKYTLTDTNGYVVFDVEEEHLRRAS